MQKIVQKFRLQENHDLSQYSTMRIGGKAQYFYEAHDQDELVSLLNELYTKNIPFRIFGAGGNCLFADDLYKGVVIRNRMNKIFVQENKITAESGVTIGKFNSLCKEHGLSGLEMLINVPGTVGGVIWNNAGAYNMETKDIVTGGKVWNRGEVKTVDKEFFEFGYRTSILKKSNDHVLLEAEFQLIPVGKEKIEKRMEEIFQIRLKKEPKGLTCGSFFRNSKGDFAGRLLEEIGAKGVRMGDLEVAEKHANWILNTGNAKPKDLLKLRDMLKSKVKERFGVELREEIDIISTNENSKH